MDDIKQYFRYKSKKNYVIIISNFIFLNSISIGSTVFINNYMSDLLPVMIIISSLVFLLSISGFFTKNQYQGITYKEKIYSLKNDVRTKSKINGSFILGTGNINGSSKVIDYYIYYKEARFGLVKNKLEAKDVELIQRDDINPCFLKVLVEGEEYKVLIVPKNTVKRKISIEIYKQKAI